MLVQIHMLQNYAPANLNRDDTGAPKDAMFGGVRRGRISSQCLKRSIRRSATFAEAFGKSNLLAKRTKLLPKLVRAELRAMKVAEAAIEEIVARVPEIGKKAEQEDAAAQQGAKRPAAEGELETRQLIFLGADEVRPLAEKLRTLHKSEGKNWAKVDLEAKLGELGASVPRSVDVAMFGRMTTSEAFEDVQAAVQVAHALSTNALVQEFDYFTAMDDISDEAAAGMISDVEFNSSTYYKYLNVHWEGLTDNLHDGEVARRSVCALLEAFATAQPSGKQNSFAAHCLPDFVLVEVGQRNLPVSYANAFVRPARADGDQSLMDASVAQLADYLARVSTTYDLCLDRAYTATTKYTLEGAAWCNSLAELGQWLQQRLPAGGA